MTHAPIELLKRYRKPPPPITLSGKGRPLQAFRINQLEAALREIARLKNSAEDVEIAKRALEYAR